MSESGTLQRWFPTFVRRRRLSDDESVEALERSHRTLKRLRWWLAAFNVVMLGITIRLACAFHSMAEELADGPNPVVTLVLVLSMAVGAKLGFLIGHLAVGICEMFYDRRAERMLIELHRTRRAEAAQ
ncbi:MAG: hypothetical protein KF774_08390 [Planctomyces sp.]|nr:hypothetical protein [Planctomyces sp.]